ncbi:MAG: cytochrome c biogenesis protein CcsA [Pyrodictiaceae archaeon]
MARGLIEIFKYMLPIFVLVDTALTLYASLHAPFPLLVPLGSPTAYINIYIHVPMAWASYMLFTGALISAILFLWRGIEKYDRLVYGFAFIGIIYAIATTFSGSAWASESWGSPWNWDPRETGIVLLLLAYSVYFAIRSSIPDPDRASRLSAVYAIAAYSTVPLSFLAPSIAGGLHPTPKATAGLFSHSEVVAIFTAKLLLASVIAIGLAVLASNKANLGKLLDRKGKTLYAVTGLASIIVAIAALVILVLPYIEGNVDRVLAANISNGLITSVSLSSGKSLVFKHPVKSPISPAVIEVEGKPMPTIVGHIVQITNSGIKIVIHWSVAVNVLLYLSVVGLLMLLIARWAK